MNGQEYRNKLADAMNHFEKGYAELYNLISWMPDFMKTAIVEKLMHETEDLEDSRYYNAEPDEMTEIDLNCYIP